MADKVDDIRQEIKKGRQDIADTRSAMTEKLAILEERVQETIDGVKHAFDLHYQVKQRPWLIFGGSLLVGYTLGRRGNVSGPTADTIGEPSSHAQSRQTIVNEIRSQVQDDLAAIKGAVFGAVVSTLWAMVKQVVLPPTRQIDGAITMAAAPSIDSQQITSRLVISKTNGRSEA